MKTNQMPEEENPTNPLNEDAQEWSESNPSSQPETKPDEQPNEAGPDTTDPGSHFWELDDFHLTPISLEELNGQNAYTNPGDEFKTGHWAIEPPSPQETQVSEPVRPEMDGDFVETIPPETSVNQPLAEEILPETVGEVDPQATLLNPVAFTPAIAEVSHDTQPVSVVARGKPTPVYSRPTEASRGGKTQPTPVGGKPPLPPARTKKKKGCLGRGVLIAFIVLLLVLLVGGIFAISRYLEIASTLPSVDELQNRASQFETTYILDRNGNILYEIVDPNAGKRTYVPLERISPYLIAATIATEDKEYYNHPGFDLIALTRALYSNYTSGEIVSGASTITQQLARLLLLTEERYDVTYERKAREIILSAEITRRYTKEQVLELYLNEIFYGNLSYGVEAASATYFNTTAADLNLWQSAFLAGIPQAPAVYDVYNNREATINRFKTVLVLMYKLSNETGCIHIGENLEPVCVDAIQTIEASDALESYEFTKRDIGMQFPHWVVFVQSLLESQFDAQTIYRSGFTVYTTIDPDMQREAEQAVKDQLAQMAGKNATNGAALVMNPSNGEILSMVGSADFHNAAISGQVNMALTHTRQPGSAIKPLTYLAAFEKDWNPSTLIWDVPTKFRPSTDPFDTSPDYEPINYDGRFHGPQLVRDALANSYNIPAVKALEYVGIYDDPATPQQDGFINFARRLGITSLNRPDYGLSLTLGGGEVSLLELTGAFQVLANEGRRVAPVAITKVVDHQGNVLFEYQPPAGDQVVRSAHTYLISSILSDPVARAPMFGINSILNLPFPSAAKTGTTNDFRDNWTLGYTPDLVVGVWVGNADYTPMVNTTGVEGAAPIWARIMKAGINRYNGGVATSFPRPSDVVDYTICTVSGAQPSEYCPSHKTEIFASDQPPLPADQDLWLKTSIDSWTNLQASPACAEFAKEALTINVEDESAIDWLGTQPGRDWARNNGFPDPLVIKPERECRLDDPRPIIELIGVSENGTIKESPFVIAGVIDATANFKQFKIHWGKGPDPNEWYPLTPDWITRPVTSAAEILTWDMEDIDADVITLRVTLHSTINTEVQKKWVMRVEVPTPTPTQTPTVTMTPTMTATLPPEPTATPTPPPAPTATSTPPAVEPTAGP